MSRGTIVVVAALFVVTACSGSGEKDTSTPPPPGTTTTTSTTSSTTSATTTTSGPFVAISGADAAPRQPGSIAVSELFNGSPEAASLFRWWIQYETPLEYWNKYATSQQVADKLYLDGKGVCVSLSQGVRHDTTISVLQKLPYDYNATEAAAIHMAAVQALCPHRQAGTDRTAIDKNASIAFAAVPRFQMADGTFLQVYDVVWAGKFACYYLERNGFRGLEGFLRQYPATVKVADPRLHTTVMEQVVAAATRSQCFPQSSLVMSQPWVR